MPTSILNDVKLLVGVHSEYSEFDSQIIAAVNAELAVLHDLGVGPSRGIFITGAEETWDYITEDNVLLGFVKECIHLRVTLLFDSLQSNSMKDILTKQLDEMEWRACNYEVDSRGDE